MAPVIPVKIGFLGAMTGAGAAVNRAVENGERLAVSQFAGDHPRFDLVLNVRSTDGTPAGAAAAARRLVADGVLAVIGPQAAGGVGRPPGPERRRDPGGHGHGHDDRAGGVGLRRRSSGSSPTISSRRWPTPRSW